MGFYCTLFCCALLYVHSSFAIILMGKRELDALLGLSSWCLVMVVGWLVGFVALRLKSTALVIAGRSVHLTTLFPGQA